MKTGKQTQTKAPNVKNKSNGHGWETFPKPRGWSLQWEWITQRPGQKRNQPVRRKR